MSTARTTSGCNAWATELGRQLRPPVTAEASPERAARPHVLVLEHGEDLLGGAAQDVRGLVAELRLHHRQQRLVRRARLARGRPVAARRVQLQHRRRARLRAP